MPLFDGMRLYYIRRYSIVVHVEYCNAAIVRVRVFMQGSNRAQKFLSKIFLSHIINETPEHMNKNRINLV